MDRQDFLTEMEKAFSDGMSRGWSAGREGMEDPSFPGRKHILMVSGIFRIKDFFHYGKGGCGGGFTTIRLILPDRLTGPVLWAMNYSGVYPEEVIPFLKEVLLYAYLHKIFCGGRGAEGHEKGDLLYENHLEEGSSFRNFSGMEAISRNGKKLGWHQFDGMSYLF